jgi:hypothetical protein
VQPVQQTRPNQALEEGSDLSGVFGETVTIGQENGPDVELVVFGDEHSARYETRDGYPVLYDRALGLFCYALVRDGRFESSGVAVDRPPPAGARAHARESSAVRRARAGEQPERIAEPPRDE